MWLGHTIHGRMAQIGGAHNAIHTFQRHGLDKVFAIFVGHCAHWSFLLLHFVVAIFEVAQ
jgi:hypothetical protein